MRCTPLHTESESEGEGVKFAVDQKWNSKIAVKHLLTQLRMIPQAHYELIATFISTLLAMNWMLQYYYYSRRYNGSTSKL